MDGGRVWPTEHLSRSLALPKRLVPIDPRAEPFLAIDIFMKLNINKHKLIFPHKLSDNFVNNNFRPFL